MELTKILGLRSLVKRAPGFLVPKTLRYQELTKVVSFSSGVTVPLTMYPVLFLIGVLMWTLDEYVVHRWLFHMRPPANSKFLITAHFLLHGQHHKVRGTTGANRI